ncbi:hypothetical protein JHK82_044131 [Glycine max]|nr:hypothetical protein JHK82_044131 [Glycine max]
MNHAFFKALLFLSAGSVIHAMSDEQDMRKMGGLASSFPFTYAMMLMGSLSLIGFPFLTGFYSKDVILELAYTKYTISGNFAFWLGSVSPISKYCDEAAVAHPTRSYEVTIHPTRSSGVNKNWGSDAGEIPANG